MKKIESLTALRFFAAVPIVVEHCRPAFRSMAWISPQIPFDYGVSFFFVLSGFILSYAHREFVSARDLKDFYVARVARVWPLHIFMLAAFFLVLPKNWWFFGWTDDHHLSIFLANLFLVHAWIPKVAYFFSFNAVSWSISAEAFFYLVFPFLRNRLKQTWHWKSAIVAIVVIAILSVTTTQGLHQVDPTKPLMQSTQGWGYISPFTRIAEFLLGMLAWAAYDGMRRHMQKIRLAFGTSLEILSIAVIPAVAFSSVYCYVRSQGAHDISAIAPNPALEFVYHCAAAPAFALMIFVFASGRGVLSRWLSSRPLMILGEASFALYLCHQLIFIVFSNYRSEFDAPDLVQCLGYWMTTIGVSLLLWRLVETPARDWIRNRTRRGRIEAAV